MEQASRSMLVDIEQLAAAIHEAYLSRPQLPPSSFWDYDDIAYHLRASKSTVTRWVALPDFPRPIRPPTAGRGLGHPLYLPATIPATGGIWRTSEKEGEHGAQRSPKISQKNSNSA